MERDVIVSKNSEENWKNDEIQFPRLIAEMDAAGFLEGEGLDDIAEAMGLTTEQVRSLVDRAQTKWDAIKALATADDAGPQQLLLPFDKEPQQ